MTIKSSLPASVLFVDDEEKARKYFALAMAGEFDVKTAGSAAEALDILALHAQEIAIIVSDQRMPEKSGVELLKAVRAYHPHIVRLLTTAYTDLEDAIEAINRGEILRYIQKPWDINALKAELKQSMNYFQLRHERDKLLEEKLSVKQSMIQIERISQLMLFAEAIPLLRFTGQATRRYIDHLVSVRPLVSDESGVPPMLDLWSQTVAETIRMQHFIRKVADELSGHLPTGPAFGTQLDLPALRSILQETAREAGLQLEVADDAQIPADGMRVDGPLFRLMLAKLFSVLRDRNVTRLDARLSATGTPPYTGMQVVFTIGETDFAPLHAVLGGWATRQIPVPCMELLLVFLACVHHGGSLELGTGAGRNTVVLSLPAHPQDATLPADPPAWHENILASFEPEIY